jgi:hypothetical protein
MPGRTMPNYEIIRGSNNNNNNNNNNNSNNNNNNNNTVDLVRERTLPTERPPLVEKVIFSSFSSLFYFFFQVVPQFAHEAQWTPLHTHYTSENLVAPGIQPGPLSVARNSGH